MELDVAAWIAYSAVFVIALYTAHGQVNKLLDVPGKWRYGEAYVLWAVFFFLPATIFWALDRVGAIHDSSLISALVVAFSYKAIVQKTSPIQSNAVSAIFQPVLTWASTLRQTLAESISRSDTAFATAVTVKVGNDALLLPVLENWAMSHVDDPATLATRLQEFETANPDPTLGGGVPPGSLVHLKWCRDKAERIVAFVRAGLWRRVRFVWLGLTPGSALWSALIPYRPVARYGMLTLVILFIAFSISKWVSLADGRPALEVIKSMVSLTTLRPAYDQWRFLKPGNTPPDVARSLADLRKGLASELASDQTASMASKPAEFTHTFIAMLEDETLTKTQAESLLRLVLSERLSTPAVGCPALKLLAQTLRAPGVTTRALVDGDLVSASNHFWKGTNDAVRALDTGTDVGLVDLESAVNGWTGYLTTQCAGQTQTLTTGGPGRPPVAPPTDPPGQIKVDSTGHLEPQKIVLPGVNFKFNSAELAAAPRPLLDVLAKKLAEQPQVQVAIDGYTDSIGNKWYNINLSWRRASAVRDYLLAAAKVQKEQLAAHGFGAADPVADNKTEEGRARNRRVVLNIGGKVPESLEFTREVKNEP